MGGKGYPAPAAAGTGGGTGKAASSRSAAEAEGEDEDAELDDPAGSEDGAFFGSEAEANASADEDMALEVRSPFGPEVFPSAAACWAHAAAEHGFSLPALRKQIGPAWTDYHRIRLVNHLRALGPEAARRRARELGPDSPIWTDDALLRPVLEDDALLFEADDEDEAEAEAEAEAAAAAAAAAARGAEPAGPEASEVAALRAELAEVRRLLTEADGLDRRRDDSPAPSPPQEREGLEAEDEPGCGVGGDSMEAADARELVLDPSLAEAFQRALLVGGRPALEGRTVLNAGCGAGVLSCLCAQAGARVVAVDQSAAALRLARALAEANGLDSDVQLLRGSAGGADRSAGALACDVLTSERLLGAPLYAPLLLELLTARERHLKPGGRVLPAEARLCLGAGDFSAEAAHSLEWSRPWAALGGLDLGALRPALAAPPVAEVARDLPEERVASAGHFAELVCLRLAEAAADEALPRHKPFRLDLRPDRCMTSLLLRLQLGPGEGAEAAGVARSAARRRITVLHLPAPPGLPPTTPLRLPGADFPVVEGHFSASWSPEGPLRVTVELAAARRGSGGGDGEGQGKGEPPVLRTRGDFELGGDR